MPSQDSNTPLHVVQITDTHLGASAGDALVGLDTDYSLDCVLDLIRREQLRMDVLLVTGDISNCGDTNAYRRVEDKTAPFCSRRHWLPGNHDLPERMRQVAPARMDGAVEYGNWLILLLDSSVRNEVGGALADSELARLEQVLAGAGDRHVLVCLHHHPIASGCEWLDTQQVSNSDAFFAVIDRFPQVRAVLWGHIHQETDRYRGNVRLLSTPSTCIQFAPDSKGFRLDRRNPGYRWLQLYADGRIETAVSRVQGVYFGIDYEQTGGY